MSGKVYGPSESVGDPFHVGSGGAGVAWYPLNLKTGNDIGIVALSVDVLYAIPFIVREILTLDRLALSLTTGGGAGSVARIGIYSAISNRSLYPGAKVGNDDIILDTSPQAIVSATISKILTPGVYFLAINPGVAGFSVQAIPTYQAPMILGFSAAFVAQTIITKANAYAALADPFPAGGAYSNALQAVAWARLSA